MQRFPTFSARDIMLLTACGALLSVTPTVAAAQSASSAPRQDLGGTIAVTSGQAAPKQAPQAAAQPPEPAKESQNLKNDEASNSIRVIRYGRQMRVHNIH
jgi:hypothetical protein